MRMLKASLLSVAALFVGFQTSLRAEDAPIPKLEKHPYADAQPGEWRRLKRTTGTDNRFYVERVIGVKPAESLIFFDVLEVTEDGKQRKAVAQPGRWFSVPSFRPLAGQQFTTDEMVSIDVNGKKLTARHLKIVEPTDPPAPGRTRTREVWFSNDVLGNGKAKEQLDQPATTLTTLDWGTMTPEDLAKARAEYKLDGATAPGTSPAPAPSQPPSGGATGACGAACGGK